MAPYGLTLKCQYSYMLLLSFSTPLTIYPTTIIINLYRVSQELRSLLQDLIPELMLSQKRHIHMGPIGNGSGGYEFL